MSIFRNNKGHIIYCYFFSDRTAYVGQTSQPNQRHSQHLCTGRVSEKIKSGKAFDYEVLQKHLYGDDVGEREAHWCNVIELRGWKLLNITSPKATAYSRPRIWTMERLSQEAARFNSLREWRLGSPKSYSTACKRGCTKALSAHMEAMPPKLDNIYGVRVTKTTFNNIRKLSYMDRKHIGDTLRKMVCAEIGL